MTAIKDAIEYLGAAKCADLFRVTVQAVCFYRDGKRRFPAEFCPIVERESGRKYRCEQLRPDVDWAYVRSNGPDCVVEASS